MRSGRPVVAFAVAAGAAAGAGARLVVLAVVGGAVGVAAVNVGGTFVLGVVLARTRRAMAIAALGTGFCGGLTTFSAFTGEAVTLARDARWAAAMVFVVFHVTVPPLAALAGYRLAGPRPEVGPS